MCFGVLTGRVSGLKVEDGLDCLYSSLCSCSRLFLQLRLVSNECTARHPRLFSCTLSSASVASTPSSSVLLSTPLIFVSAMMQSPLSHSSHPHQHPHPHAPHHSMSPRRSSTSVSQSSSASATPKSSAISKKPGAPKAKGAIRAKSGCYTCRIRRKVRLFPPNFH